MQLPHLEVRGSEPHHAALRLAHAAVRGALLNRFERLHARNQPVPDAAVKVRVAQPCTDVGASTLFSPLETILEHSIEVPDALWKLLETRRQETLLRHIARIGGKPGIAGAGVTVECRPFYKQGKNAFLILTGTPKQYHEKMRDAGLLVRIRYPAAASSRARLTREPPGGASLRRAAR